jgi:hypothetical protein
MEKERNLLLEERNIYDDEKKELIESGEKEEEVGIHLV